MPLRPPDQVESNRPDNTQQVTQAPTVVNETVATRALEETWSGAVGEEISTPTRAQIRRVNLLGTGGGGTRDEEVYVFGTNQGNVSIIDSEDGSELFDIDVSGSRIVDVGLTLESGSAIISLSEDGNLYRHRTTGTQDWSFTVGGTPECFISIDDSEEQVYVGQPDGQADEFYAVAYPGGAGTANWTYTGSGGFSGGSVIDGGYVYCGPGGDVARLDVTSGAEDWAVTPGTTNEEIRGKIAVDSDNVYALMSTPSFTGSYFVTLDKTNGSEVWADDQFQSIVNPEGTPGVVQDADAVYYYPDTYGNLVARDKDTSEELWTAGGRLSIDTSLNADTWIEQVGNGIYVTRSEASEDDFDLDEGDVIDVDRSDGSIRETITTDGNTGIALGSRSPYVVYGDDTGDYAELNVANTNVSTPIRVGSRPFLSLGVDSDGAFDLNVHGAPDDTFDIDDPNVDNPIQQETISLPRSDIIEGEQIPWWSWEYVQLEIDDMGATAGDVTLFISASR